MRTSAPAGKFGFRGFSPYALPSVIQVAEGVPFIELTQWDHQKLYALKGAVVGAGVRAVTGLQMPLFDKERFQRGAVSGQVSRSLFPSLEQEYRDEFQKQFC